MKNETPNPIEYLLERQQLEPEEINIAPKSAGKALSKTKANTTDKLILSHASKCIWQMDREA